MDLIQANCRRMWKYAIVINTHCAVTSILVYFMRKIVVGEIGTPINLIETNNFWEKFWIRWQRKKIWLSRQGILKLLLQEHRNAHTYTHTLNTHKLHAHTHTQTHCTHTLSHTHTRNPSFSQLLSLSLFHTHAHTLNARTHSHTLYAHIHVSFEAFYMHSKSWEHLICCLSRISMARRNLCVNKIALRMN